MLPWIIVFGHTRLHPIRLVFCPAILLLSRSTCATGHALRCQPWLITLSVWCILVAGSSLRMKPMDFLRMDTSINLPHAPVRMGMLSDCTHGWQPWLVTLSVWCIMPTDPSFLMKPCIPFWDGQLQKPATCTDLPWGCRDWKRGFWD